MRNGGTSGKYNIPGLPEISGYINIQGSQGGGFWTNERGGALTFSSEQSDFQLSSISGGPTYSGIIFSAGGSNKIYGSSSTVMPSSVDFIVGLYIGVPA